MADETFRISMPYDTREQLLEWGSLASSLGLRDEYIADLRFLNEQLKYAPRNWGDAISDLEAARLVRYRGLSTYLRVYYAAHVQDPVVFVSSIELRHDRPLGRAVGK